MPKSPIHRQTESLKSQNLEVGSLEDEQNEAVKVPPIVSLNRKLTLLPEPNSPIRQQEAETIEPKPEIFDNNTESDHDANKPLKINLNPTLEVSRENSCSEKPKDQSQRSKSLRS